MITPPNDMHEQKVNRLERAHFHASGLIAFGLGHLLLNQLQWGLLVAMILIMLGATGKIVVHSMLEKHYRSSNPKDL